MLNWSEINNGNTRATPVSQYYFFVDFCKHFDGLYTYFVWWVIFQGKFTAQKMKFSLKDFFSKCYQIRIKLRIGHIY